MEAVLAIYEKPYNPREPVVYLDEKPIVLHRDLRPATQAQPNQPAKRDYEYERCGTANVFCAVEPRAGRHFTWPTPNRSGKQFAGMLQRIAKAYPSARTIHLVMDNLSTHARSSLVRHLGPKPSRSTLEPIHDPLHSQTRQLAQPGRDRNQYLRPPMLRLPPHRIAAGLAHRMHGLESHCQPPAPQNQLDLLPSGRRQCLPPATPTI